METMPTEEDQIPEERLEESEDIQPEPQDEAVSNGEELIPEPPAAPPSAEETAPKQPAKKNNYFKFLTKPNACLIAALILTFSCCCGLIVGTGFTAWLYETVEGPYYYTQVAVTELYTQVAVTEFAVTQVFITMVPGSPVPTYTCYPTYTPLPTFSPYPYTEPVQTETPTVTQAPTSTPEPTRTPVFTERYRFSGTGKETTNLFSLEQGMIRVKWSHVGEANFALSLKRLDTDDEEMLENTIGDTEGQAILNVEESDQYIFDILLADGIWEIIVEYRP